MINSLMRTLVPAIYLGLIHLGLSKDIPQDWVVNLISLVVLAAVYLVLRLLEQRWRWIGLLLGWIGAPTYDQVDQAKTATRDDLIDVLQATEKIIVGQVQAHMHSIVTGESARQTNVLVKELKPRTKPLGAEAARTPRKAPAKKATDAKKPLN